VVGLQGWRLPSILFLLVLLTACGNGQEAATTITPESLLAPEEARIRAFEVMASPLPDGTTVQEPENPVVSLLTWREYAEAVSQVQGSQPRSKVSNDQPVWVVQVEGKVGQKQLYAAIVLDAQTRRFLHSFYNAEPILLPREFPEVLLLAGDFGPIDRRSIRLMDPRTDLGPTSLSRNEALSIFREHLRRGYSFSGLPRVESVKKVHIALVRYNFKDDSNDQVGWFIMGMQPLVLEPGYERGSYWGDYDYCVIDIEWGGCTRGGTHGLAGPSFASGADFALVRPFAEAHGWWRLWHLIKDYNGGKFLPEELLSQLKSQIPDAATSTP
jgi:hypothetical protein